MTSIPIKFRTGTLFSADDDLGVGEPVFDPASGRFGIGHGEISPRYYPSVDMRGDLVMSYNTKLRMKYPNLKDSYAGWDGENFVVNMNGVDVLVINRLGIRINGLLSSNSNPSSYFSGDAGLSELLFPFFSSKTLLANFGRPIMAAVDSNSQFKTYRSAKTFATTFGSFSRNAPATYTNQFGNRVLASIDEPRVTYFVRSKKCRGLHIEPTSTNLISYSYDLTKAVTNNLSLTQLYQRDFQRRGYSVPYTFDAGTTNGEHRIIFSITGNVTLPFCASHIFKALPFAGTQRFTLYVSDGSRSNVFGINCNVTGSIVTFDSNLIIGNGVVSNLEIENLNDGFYRIKIAGTVNPSGSNSNAPLSLVFSTLPPSGANLSYTPSGITGNWGLITDFQCEQRSIHTSYIPTNGGPVTRPADTLSLNLSNFKYTFEEGMFEFGFRGSESPIGAIVYALTDGLGNRTEFYIANKDTSNITIGQRVISNYSTISNNTNFTSVPLSKGTFTYNYTNIDPSYTALVVDGSTGFQGTVNLISYE